MSCAQARFHGAELNVRNTKTPLMTEALMVSSRPSTDIDPEAETSQFSLASREEVAPDPLSLSSYAARGSGTPHRVIIMVEGSTCAIEHRRKRVGQNHDDNRNHRCRTHWKSDRTTCDSKWLQCSDQQFTRAGDVVRAHRGPWSQSPRGDRR